MKSAICLSLGLATLLSLATAQINNTAEHVPNHPHYYKTTPETSESIPPECDKASPEYNSTLCALECAKEPNKEKPYCHENHTTAAPTPTVPSATAPQSTTTMQTPTTHHPSSAGSTTTTSVSLAVVLFAVYACSL